MNFNDLPISDSTKDAVAAMGYETTTPIQKDAIPALLDGKDLIGRAATGTGKTAAFGIPLIERLQVGPKKVRALVLVPTRELAMQVTEVLRDIARSTRIRVSPVYGGTGFKHQIEAFRARDPTVIVACPGRLLDLCQRGQADLSEVEYLVLDEADRMLDMGFIHDIKKILKMLPDERQTSLFSATIDKRIRNLSQDFLWQPVTVEVDDHRDEPLTEQFQVRVTKTDKHGTLLSILHDEVPDKAVVFTRTKHLAKRLAQKLDKQGWSSVALQGNMSQSQRERALQAFRDSKARILVATDVAARGLDVPDITHVINFDLPMETEAYVHRVGRTGRNGRTGRSYAFVMPDEKRKMGDMERLAGRQVAMAQIGLHAGDQNGPDQAGRNDHSESERFPAQRNGQGGHQRRRPQGNGQAPFRSGRSGQGGGYRGRSSGGSRNGGGSYSGGGSRGGSRNGGGSHSSSGGSRSNGPRGGGPRHGGGQRSSGGPRSGGRSGGYGGRRD